MKICDSTNECVGFNTHGWLKKKCPSLQVEQSVNTYLIDTSSYLWNRYLCIVHVPTGKEPKVLLWPMPKEYKSGDVDIVVDVQRLAFNSNYQSEELHNAILRMKKTVFTHPFAQGAETAIHEVNIIIKNEFVPFVVSSLY